MKKWLTILVLVVAAASAAFFLASKKTTKETTIRTKLPGQTITPGQSNDANPSIPGNEREVVIPNKTLIDVPFTSQAPFANWSDPNEEAGCEEASMIMAAHWIKGDIQGGTIDQQQAENELQALFQFEQQHYGNSIDTSAADTAKTFKDYYGYKNILVVAGITKDDIIAALAAGKVVLVPVNGQALNNPHFKVPGPLTHMLLIRGYDNDAEQFITNDPGTKAGQAYVYDFNTLYNAIRDYPTGNHLPITGDNKVMIAVGK